MPWFGKDRSEVPRAWAAAVEEVVEAADMPSEVTDFVLTGQPVDALKAVISSTDVPWRRYDSRLWRTDAAKKAMATLYTGLGEVDAVVLRRWGWVLDAAWGRSGLLTFGDLAGRHWPELMLRQAEQAISAASLPISFADLERIAAVDGTPPAALVRMAFTFDPRHRHGSSGYSYGPLSRLAGFTDAVAVHRDVPAAVLMSGSVDERVGAATFLGVLGEPALGALAEPLAEAATSTSAQVRDAARPLVERLGSPAVGPLRRLATEGTPERRGHALELLAARPDQRAWAVQTADADRAASVRALSARWAAADALAATAGKARPDLPPLPSWSLAAADAQRVATEVVETIRREVEARNRPLRAYHLQHYPKGPQVREIAEPPPATVDRLARLLAADGPAQVSDKLDGLPGSAVFSDELAAMLREQGYPAATVMQVMAALGWIDPARYGYRMWDEVIDELHARTGGPDLLTLQRMFDAVGADGRALVWSVYSAAWGSRTGRDWPNDQVWPFVAHNLDWIVKESPRKGWNLAEHAAYTAIATLPERPAWLVEHLYSLAIGALKNERAPAQAALERDPQRTARAAAALQDGKADTRLAAAQWLTRIADPAALPALRAAWKKEKQDVCRGALLDALTAIGEDAGAYLSPAVTLAAAAKFTANGPPSSLAWLNWAALPELTWVSSGEPVPLAVVQWLCGTAVKARSPEPGAMLRHYAALFDAAGREALAARLFTEWLREDLRPVSPAQAQARAAHDAPSYHQWYSAPNGRYAGMTVEQVEAALLSRYVKEPAGSATASKGLLAVVAACGGRDVVPPAGRYLREWFGQRPSQGKALIAMLAWVEHPSAIQLVLAIGARFRTKSFQDEAMRQAAALAERKGWTVDELADRTIPTAGFEDGVLELPYGPRTFTARLRPDLTVELRDADGKAVKALPAPRQSDDADRAKESKKALSAAKQELKSIATLQSQRLYEAMCTERTWSALDWDRYLLRHPVAGPLVRRLVWVAQAPDGAATAFRPLDDDSLTDASDNDVALPDGARVKVAHDSGLSPDEVARWTAHLADYAVTPLFEQLGRGVHVITPDLRSKRQLADFTGHLLEAFALRGRAGQLGYARGPGEDGGWFYRYEKRFPTLGIVAVISFTGSPLPEENRLVALKELAFQREAADGHRAELTLGDVPTVLASECWQDMRAMAAEGTGFDPEWEKKTEFVT